MANFELRMPKLGESITEATITKWLKNVGDTIELDDPILELATDKVDSEIPSPVEGVLKKQLFNEGDTVEVETVIAIIDTSGEAGGEDDDEDAAPAQEQKPEAPAGEVKADSEATGTAAEEIPATRKGEGERFYSPLVRSIAQKENIAMAELDKVEGSGQNGRVTKEDLLKYLETRQEKPADTQKQAAAPQPAPQPAPAAASAPAPKPHAPKIHVGEGDEVVEMDRMRKLIADHMVQSLDTSAHITIIREADMTKVVKWRNKQKNVLQQRDGEKLTFTPIFIEAIAKALREYPNVNISVDGHNIIKRKNINIGMAAALPSGNLIVPVIKNADHKSLLGIAKEVNDLTQRARQNKLKPDEIQGGTFTLTNFGTFGALMGTPIINQPEVAILGVGMIEKKPVVVETPDGDTIAIRHRMVLSLSCDHRVIDGALGGMFLQKIAENLENFDVNQTI
jgi:2-oxoglutarate dehydrogenase E2 component (dihydrolipoamide succinyltransferase)